MHENALNQSKMPDCHYRISVKALVIDDTGRFLLCLDSSGKWELPGGGLDHGETVKDGLKREIREEMGLETTYISDLPSYFLTVLDHEKNEWIGNVLYLTRLKNLDFTPSGECLEFRFFNCEQALRENLFENVEKFIELYRLDSRPMIHG